MGAAEISPRPLRSGSLANRIGWWVFALMCLGIVGYAWTVAILDKFPAPVAANGAGLTVLVIHASSAAVALLIGPFQFVPRIRTRHRRIHRWMGRVYCVACLVGGVAGAALAWGTTSGSVARFGFAGLAIAWMACTSLAWASAVSADFARHRVWMLRSFSLTFAAVTLRIYLPLSQVAGLSFAAAYPVIAWACWVPNLMFAELWLRRAGRNIRA